MRREHVVGPQPRERKLSRWAQERANSGVYSEPRPRAPSVRSRLGPIKIAPLMTVWRRKQHMCQVERRGLVFPYSYCYRRPNRERIRKWFFPDARHFIRGSLM